MPTPLRVLVIGCGHMGASHARAYHHSEHFEIAGLVSRQPESREQLARNLGRDYPTFSDGVEAIATLRPDAVCISTYPDTHARFARAAMEHGAHVFLEKPLTPTVQESQELVDLSRKTNRKLVVGYILQHHPAWIQFVEEARKLGNPLVMRMNLNQQSSGAEWQSHRNIMASMSPIVDCGVHYVDIMCRMTCSRPTRVHAMGVRLTEEIPASMYNYGQLQVVFENGSVGWYEAGWGPMMSQTAFFVKDVVGPEGCVSIAAAASTLSNSADINSHTKTDSLIIHRAELNESGRFSHPDEILKMTDEPDHDALCAREQAFFAEAIRSDLDLTEHLDAAVRSLQIVLAADESVRTGQAITL